MDLLRMEPWGSLMLTWVIDLMQRKVKKIVFVSYETDELLSTRTSRRTRAARCSS